MALAKEVEYGEFQCAPRGGVGVDLLPVRRHPRSERFQTVHIAPQRRLVPQHERARRVERFACDVWARTRLSGSDLSIGRDRLDPDAFPFRCAPPTRGETRA